MNIYGDTGNIITLKNRIAQRGYRVEVLPVEVGESIPEAADIIIGGGGQDTGQLRVAEDLQTKRAQLLKMRDDGVVMLMICGTYQLFGHSFTTQEKTTIPGIGLFDMETIAGQTRLIGNVVATSDYGELVGFENHSGQTTLHAGQAALAEVVSGAGNNDQTKDEGAISHNAFGSYLHGPLLPKNPRFADELVKRALVRRGVSEELRAIDDQIAQKAAAIARSRPR
jgi:CobQ-like glutamine amidotransferase family enzyme